MKSVLAILILMLPMHIHAQVDVHDEKLHKLIFQNEYLNVIEIIAKPGDAAEMHTHNFNYTYIALNGGKMLLQDKGEKEREVQLPDFFTGGKYKNHIEPFSHRFVNLDENDIHFLAVEHKSSYKLTKDLRISYRPEDILIDNQFFLVVKIKIQALASISKEVPYPGVLINPRQKAVSLFEEESHSTLSLWSYHEAGTKLRMSNKEKEEEVLYLFMTK